MYVIRTNGMEVGVDLERVSAEALMEFFQTLRECPECGSDPQALAEIEENVWREYLRSGRR